MQVEIYDIKISLAKQLVGDVKTRWNSTYLMLLRIQTLRQALIPFMQEEAELGTSAWTEVKSLDPNDWSVLDNMLVLLEPFFRYTEIMSANKLTIAQVIIVMKNLEMEVKDLPETYVYRMKVALLAGLQTRFFSENPRETTGGGSTIVEYNILEDTRFSIPPSLNPQFRLRPFKNKDLKNKVKAALATELTELARMNEEKRRDDEMRMRLAAEEARARATTTTGAGGTGSGTSQELSSSPPVAKRRSMMLFLEKEDDEQSGKFENIIAWLANRLKTEGIYNIASVRTWLFTCPLNII